MVIDEGYLKSKEMENDRKADDSDILFMILIEPNIIIC